MLIATIPLPDVLDIPEDVRQQAHRPNIGTSWSPSMPFGANGWIYCCYAMPHKDPGWSDYKFLTLSVVSSHRVGDALLPDSSVDAVVGGLFVIDPLVTHWLHADDACFDEKLYPWIGVQWEVERRNVKRKARELVAKYHGRWLPCEDKRYRDWAVD